MTLWSKIRALISGIGDPKVRMDVASSINFLFDLFRHGNITEEQLKKDLTDICGSVIEVTNPLIPKDEVRERAEIVADDLIRTMKVESIHYRVRSRLKSLLPP
jgi:hypothetical protein